MSEDIRSSEERLYVERSRQLAAEVQRLTLRAAEVAEQTAVVERDVAAMHEVLAESHPLHPEFADKAEHARRSAESAESFAAAERQVADARDAIQARQRFEPYQRPEPTGGR